jgi:hypothetical protein
VLARWGKLLDAELTYDFARYATVPPGERKGIAELSIADIAEAPMSPLAREWSAIVQSPVLPFEPEKRTYLEAVLGDSMRAHRQYHSYRSASTGSRRAAW